VGNFGERISDLEKGTVDKLGARVCGEVRRRGTFIYSKRR
jgi:hypothetical protein